MPREYKGTRILYGLMIFLPLLLLPCTHQVKDEGGEKPKKKPCVVLVAVKSVWEKGREEKRTTTRMEKKRRRHDMTKGKLDGGDARKSIKNERRMRRFSGGHTPLHTTTQHIYLTIVNINL